MQIDFNILGADAIVIAFIGGVWSFFRWINARFNLYLDKRFEAVNEKINTLNARQHELEALQVKLEQLHTEIAEKYVTQEEVFYLRQQLDHENPHLRGPND